MSSDGVREITVWETYGNEEHDVFADQIVRNFEAWYAETHHGERVRVKVQRLPFSEHIKKIKFAAITGTAPDLARVDAGELVDLVYGQAVMNLSQLDPGIEDYLKDFIFVGRNSVKIPLRQPDGSLTQDVYAIPDQVTGVAVYYNRKMFREKGLPPLPTTLAELEQLREAGTPWDWDRFHQVAAILTDTKANTFGCGLTASLWFSFPFFNSFGANFIEQTPDNKFRCALADPDSGYNALTAIATLFWDRVEAGAWQPSAVDPDRGFLNNKYGMILSGPWNLKQFENAGVDFGVGLIPEGPAMRDVEVDSAHVYRVGTYTNVGGTDMAIMKTCRDPELALAFLKYLTRADVQALWCNALGQIPIRRDMAHLVDFSANPRLRVFVEQMLTAIPRPKIPRYSVLESRITPQIERSYKAEGNRETVRAALGQAVDDIERMILADVNAER